MRPTIRILEEALIGRILEEAKRVLATVGMEIRGPEMRRRLLEHGLPMDAAGVRVLFPRDVVDAALTSAPSSFVLYDRDGNPHADLGGDRVHFVPGSSGLKVLDHRTGEVRLAGTTDFVEYVRLADGMKHIAYLATAFSTNDDIEVVVADAWRLFLTLTNSKRPVVSGAFTEHGVERMVEMQQIFRRDRADLIARPMSIFTITASGNFRYSEDSCQNLIDCVEAGIPVEIVPVTLQGLIAPVTTVGATIFHAIDVLAGITMAQVIRPGAPVLFGGAPATFHMKIASSPMAAIEALQLDVAYVEVAKALNLPCQSYMAMSDAKVLDAQAGAETFGSALLAALAGVNSVSGPGMLDFLLVFSLPKLVFDDEVCAQVLHFIRDVHPVDDLPVDRLLEQLTADQHLIMADHTTANWPRELYLPSRVWERDNRENWIKAGAPDTAARCVAEGAGRPGPRQELATDPVELADVTQRKLRRNVPRVEAAFTTWPRTLAVPPARSAAVSSIQSPPASADITSVSSLSPTFARPTARPRSRWVSTSSRRPRCWARVAGRRRPASATRPSSSKATSSRSRLCEDRIYQVSFSVGRCCLEQLHRPRSEGHLFACPDSRIRLGYRWIRAKGKGTESPWILRK